MTKHDLDAAQREMKARVQSEGRPRPTTRLKGNELWREQHFTVSELATLWKFDSKTIRRQIQADPELMAMVPKVGNGETRSKRAYFTYAVPESVAARLHAALCANL
jgi:hypothetical protein